MLRILLCCSFVEPPVAANLELSKLAHLDPHYTPSRNRQWHTYSVKQQEGRRSQTRVYLRGAIRQVSVFSSNIKHFNSMSFGVVILKPGQYFHNSSPQTLVVVDILLNSLTQGPTARSVARKRLYLILLILE